MLFPLLEKDDCLMKTISFVEITVDTGRGCSNLLNPLVAAQNLLVH